MKLHVYVVAAVLALWAAGCGKKGPPLVPYVRVPEAVQPVTVKRSGNDVYVSITVPSKNVDASLPVSISRVDIFGYTGRFAPARGRWAELATLIATVPIAPGPAPGDVPGPRGAPAPLLDAAPPGSIVTVVDTLTPDELVETAPKIPVKQAPPPKPPRGSKTPLAPAPVSPLRRFYAAFALSEKGVASPSGTVTEFQLLPVPTPPSALVATPTATGLQLTWQPSGGVLGYLLERTELAPEPSPLEEEDLALTPVAGALAPMVPMAPLGVTSYNVYRVRDPLPGGVQELVMPTATGGAAQAPPVSKWNVPAPVPINPAPLLQLAATDMVEFNRRVCYTVRAVRGTGPQQAESPQSEPFCLTPIDTFPPRPPRSLATVPATNSISLIWEASEDADVAGYLVLRGAPGDATLQTLTPTPISDARYTDTTVTPGTRYVYAVHAVDGQPTPNVSVESERVEETAR